MVNTRQFSGSTYMQDMTKSHTFSAKNQGSTYTPIRLIRREIRCRYIYLISQQARTQGGCTGCTCTTHPPPEKKVPLRNVEKGKESSTQICRQKIMHVPLRYDKIKTKKVGKKEEKISKRKGIKERG